MDNACSLCNRPGWNSYALRDGVFVDALAMARFHPKPPGIGTVAQTG